MGLSGISCWREGSSSVPGVVCVLCHSPPASTSIQALAMHPLMMAARLELAVVCVCVWLCDSVGQLRRDERDTWVPVMLVVAW